MDFAFNRLTQIAFGYWQAQCLFALAEHRVFDVMVDGPRDAAAIAEARGLDLAVAERVLDAGVAVGLLTKDDERYHNSALAARLLTSSSDGTLASWTRAMGQWAAPWSRLASTMTAGISLQRHDAGEADQEDFILGMHEFARRTASAVPDASGLHAPRRMLDVGGGAGTYAIAFCRAFPELHATVLDLAEVLPITERTVAESELGDRISTAVVDYLIDDFGDGADVVLLSNVLHQESPEAVVDMLRRAVRALRDPASGKVLVHGHFLNDNHTGPVFAALHNLSAFLLWGSGRSYTADEMRKLMVVAGLTASDPKPVSGSTTELIVGSPTLGDIR